MEQESLLLRFFGKTPLFQIVDFLVDNKGLDFSKKDLVQGANVSKASLFHYWPQLELYKIVKVVRRFGKTKLYALNTESPIVQKILELESTLIGYALENQKRELIIPQQKILSSSKVSLAGAERVIEAA